MNSVHKTKLRSRRIFVVDDLLPNYTFIPRTERVYLRKRHYLHDDISGYCTPRLIANPGVMASPEVHAGGGCMLVLSKVRA